MHRFTKDGPAGGVTCTSAIELSPEELYLAGTQYFKLRDHASARACFERYLEARPEDAAAWHLLARVCLHQNIDLEKAEVCVKRAVELDPGSLTRYVETLGIIYMHRGQYTLAEEVFAFAITKDSREDQRHTASLEYYLALAKKKAKGSAGERRDETGAPYFLAADMGRWRSRQRQGWFLFPSLVLHAVVLLAVGYISTHEMPFKKESREDFTYVEFEETRQPAVPESAVPASEAVEQQDVEAQPEPAPVTPGKTVETGDVQREPSKGTGQVELAGKGGTEGRPTIGSKAGASLEGGEPKDEMLLARAMTSEKGIEVQGRRRPPAGVEVNLVRKSLGEAARAEGRAAVKEAAVRGLGERAAAPPVSSDEGIFLGGPKQDKMDSGKKLKTVGIGDEARREELKALTRSGGEKRLDVGLPEKDKGPSMEDARDLMARQFSIGQGQSSPVRHPGAGTEKTRSLERAGPAGAAKVSDLGASAPTDIPGRAGGFKARGVISGTSSDNAGPRLNGLGERRVDSLETTGVKRFASADAVPMRKTLEMPDSGTGGRLGAPGPASSGGASAGAPASLDRKETGAAGRATGGAVVSSVGGTSGGYKAAAGSAKAVNPKALGSGGGEPSDEGEGFFARAVGKVSGILGIGGSPGRSGAPDAQPGKVGDLSGLVSSGRGGGAGPSGSGGKAAPGVRIGGGEKSRTAVSGVSPTGKLNPEGGDRAAAAGGKKMSEGLLGVPGGTGADRYASAGRGDTRPASTEKRSGVGRGGKAMARNSAGPMVSITSPSSGSTPQMSQVIRGTVSDTRTRKAVLTINNDSRVISVERGSFESVISIHKGRNIVTVTAFDLEGNAGKDSITLDYMEPTEGVPVNIISPRAGQVFDVTEKSVVKVKGTIGDQDIKKAKLILNDRPMDIVVNRGYFEQDVALVQEHNTILVEAATRDRQVSRSPVVTVSTVNVKPKDIMVILTWDKPHADVDLHVYGPGGGHTFYKSPSMYESSEAISGGQLEQDSKGNFGPEVYTQGKTDPGTYTLRSNYYYSGGDGDCNATVTVILYGDNPSRRIVRVFGPHLQVDTKTGEDTWDVTKFKMPEGIFLED